MRCFFLSHLGSSKQRIIFVGLIWVDFFHRIFCWQSQKGGLVELLGLRDFLFNSFSYFVVSENIELFFNTKFPFLLNVNMEGYLP